MNKTALSDETAMSKDSERGQVLMEVLTASGCGRCQQTKTLAREVIAQIEENDEGVDIQYREINVVEEIDYAVKLGVMSIPAIAINGELVFPAPPSATKLRQAILERIDGA